MDDDLAVFSHADALRSNAAHILQREMHDAPFPRGHGVQLERLARTLHAFRSHTRGHTQLFKTQRAVTSAVDVDFFVVSRFQPQRFERQVLEGLQDFRVVPQQNLFIPAIEIREHFRIALGACGIRRNGAHTHIQFKSGGAHDALQKMAQRLGGCLPVQLAISNEFLSHTALERIVPRQRF
jgi:hypothetical protein